MSTIKYYCQKNPEIQKKRKNILFIKQIKEILRIRISKAF